MKIFFRGINVNSGANESFNRIKKIYEEEGEGKLVKITSINNVDANMAGEFLKNVAEDLIKNIAAF